MLIYVALDKESTGKSLNFRYVKSLEGPAVNFHIQYNFKCDIKSKTKQIITCFKHLQLFHIDVVCFFAGRKLGLTLWGQMGGGELNDFSGVWFGFYKKNTLSGTCFLWRASLSKSLVTVGAAYFLIRAISICAIYFSGVKWPCINKQVLAAH